MTDALRDDHVTALMLWAWDYCRRECGTLHPDGHGGGSCPYWAGPIAFTRLPPRSSDEERAQRTILAKLVIYANSRKDRVGRAIGEHIRSYVRAYCAGSN